MIEAVMLFGFPVAVVAAIGLEAYYRYVYIPRKYREYQQAIARQKRLQQIAAENKRRRAEQQRQEAEQRKREAERVRVRQEAAERQWQQELQRKRQQLHFEALTDRQLKLAGWCEGRGWVSPNHVRSGMRSYREVTASEIAEEFQVLQMSGLGSTRQYRGTVQFLVSRRNP